MPRAPGFQLPGHFVRTVQAMVWSGLPNGRLITAMAGAGFEVLLTCDQNLTYQQPSELPVGLIMLALPNNRVPTVLALAPRVLQVLDTITPGTQIVLQP